MLLGVTQLSHVLDVPRVRAPVLRRRLEREWDVADRVVGEERLETVIADVAVADVRVLVLVRVALVLRVVEVDVLEVLQTDDVVEFVEGVGDACGVERS
ncbi:hypothetical protein MBEHAL_0626 [Halarchaeum acidiphilum MH1-52-1]|uniref:Uncharacterized protein n=1 Tax=Halarchaeum acidiphilum MH1-52-1 TaxID=1261545 RepID=U2YDU8_9EURY|nr:hypothetical protein MBEHAL_0626 [Halarchaeum acidiphilum MH1-52-1]